MEERIYILKIKDDLGKRIRPYLFLYKDEHIYQLNYYGINPIKVINGNVEKAIKSTKQYDLYSDNEILNFALKIESTKQEVGVYYPKIHRPIYENDGNSIKSRRWNLENEKQSDVIFNYDELINSFNELKTLINRLNKIILTVYPSKKNFDVYGFEIRNLLILACTEFETQIVGILKANEIYPQGNFYTTKDYFSFNSVIKLNEYSLKFKRFPKIETLEPFKNWNSNYTKSIPWYDDYNSVKHDRESNFEKATIKNALNAISACYLILIAQYGESDLIKNETDNFFSVVKKPIWNDNEKYIKPLKGNEWKSKKHNG